MCFFQSDTVLKVIVLSRFFRKMMKDLIQTVGLPYYGKSCISSYSKK